MEPEVAQQMFEEGGTLVLLGMPTGTEFGIDLNSWNVGDKFRGVKMIPPGLHFIYFSAVSRQGDTAPRTGFFHIFKQREVVVRHYDPIAEDLKVENADSEETERIQQNLYELDRYLGAYPIESWEKWISLSQYIDSGELERMLPLSGRICSVMELIPGSKWQSTAKHLRTTTPPAAVSGMMGQPSEATVTDISTSDQQSSCSDINTDMSSPCLDTIILTSESPEIEAIPNRNLPEMNPKPGTEFRFSKLPAKPYREGATPSEVTRYSLDSSYSVRHIVDKIQRPESLLSELQLAFVCFLVGQVWDGWEQWQILVTALCRAEEFMQQYPELYNKFFSVLHFQVHLVPEDLFVDIVESNNFLASALTNLFANVSDNSASLPITLVKKAQRFKTHLSNKFKWDLTLVDEGEDAPVIVET